MGKTARLVYKERPGVDGAEQAREGHRHTHIDSESSWASRRVRREVRSARENIARDEKNVQTEQVSSTCVQVCAQRACARLDRQTATWGDEPTMHNPHAQTEHTPPGGTHGRTHTRVLRRSNDVPRRGRGLLPHAGRTGGSPQWICGSQRLLSYLLRANDLRMVQSRSIEQ